MASRHYGMAYDQHTVPACIIRKKKNLGILGIHARAHLSE